MKPDQRTEERRMLGEALERLNAARAAFYSLERFYAAMHQTQGRAAAMAEMNRELTELKSRMFDLSEAAAKYDGYNHAPR